ncbi:MAG: class I SAM-dependent methyltransferase [Planctomycetota bacterium]
MDFPTRRVAWIKDKLRTADERGMAMHLCAKAQILFQGLRYASILPHLEIEGHLSVDEAIRLYDLARELPPRDGVVVEVGCGKGKASMVLAKAVQDQPSSTLYCVHSQRLSPPHEFLENLSTAGSLAVIKNLSGSPEDLAERFGRSIDLLVLGPESDFPSQLSSFRAWAPLLREGAAISVIGVDGQSEGPRRVIDRELGNRELWAEGQLVDGMYHTRKLGASSLTIGAR